MKKYFSCIVCFIFSTIPLSFVSATAPSFHEPMLEKAYTQILSHIAEKTNKIILDENARDTLGRKQESIASSLLAIEAAWQKRDKKVLRVQIGLLRERYKDILSFLEEQTRISADSRDTLSGEIDSGTGVSVDITYYADSFE